MAHESEMRFQDRDLLFGVYALQFGDVTPGQLYSAVACDDLTPSRSVSDALVRSGAISEQVRSRLSKLVETAIERHGGDVDATVSAVTHATGFLETSRRGSSRATRSVDAETVATPNPDFLDESLPGALEWRDRYTDIREHGRGGYGRVLIAYDNHLEREVAIKEMLTEFQTAPQLDQLTPSTSEHARFLREARITSQLEHPSIVPVYELGHRADGSVFYTMKLVRGKTLSNAIQSATTLEERLRLLPHFIDLCQAIAYAHSRGVIHRDIKPGNVMVGEFGETVVLDWGLAKNKHSANPSSDSGRETVAGDTPGSRSRLSQTQYGKALGTPQFMPPEQAEGRLESIDERSDVYALGVVLYELLSGSLPFEGSSIADVLWKVVHSNPKSLLSQDSDIPPELAAICERAISKNPSHRYESAGALADEINRFQSGALVQSYDYKTAEIVRRFLRRHAALFLLGGVAAILLCTLGAYSYVAVVKQRNAAVRSNQAAESARQRAVASGLEARAAQAASEESEAEALAARAQAQRDLYHANISLAHSYANQGAFEAARYQLAACPEAERNWEWGWLAFTCNQDWLDYSAPIPLKMTDGPALSLSPELGLIARRDPRGELRVMRMFTGEMLSLHQGINAQQFAASGAVLLTQDGNLLAAYDSATQAQIFEVRYASIGPWGLSKSRDENRIAFPTSLQSIQVRDLQSSEPIAECSGQYFIHAVLNADGSLLAGGGDDFPASIAGPGQIQVRRVSNCELLYTLPSTKLSQMAFSPDGRFFASPLGDNLVLYESETGIPAHRLGPQSGGLSSFSWNPNAHQILTSDEAGTTVLWDLETGARVSTLDHGGEIVSAAIFSDDGSRLLTGTTSGTVNLWNMPDTVLVRSFSGHDLPIRTLVFFPQTELVASGTARSLRVWNTDRDGIVSRKTEHVAQATMNPDGEALFLASTDGQVLKQRLDTLHASPEAKLNDLDEGSRLQVSDGARFALERRSKGLTLHDLTHGTHGILAEHGDYKSAPAAFSSDERYLALLQPRLTTDVLRVAIYDIATDIPDNPAALHEEIVDTSELERSPGSLAFRPKHNTLAVAVVDYLVLLDPSTGTPVDSFPIPRLDDRMNVPFLFDASGDYLVYVNDAEGITFLDLANFNEAEFIPTQGKVVTALTVSPGGERLIWGAEDGSVRIWNLRTHREILPLPEQKGAVRYLGLRPGGHELVAASDEEIRILRTFPWRNEDLFGDGRTSFSTKIAHVKAFHPQIAPDQARCHAQMYALGNSKRARALTEQLSVESLCPPDPGIQALLDYGCPSGGPITLGVVGAPPSCSIHGECNTIFSRARLADRLAKGDQRTRDLIAHELSEGYQGALGNLEPELNQWLSEGHYHEAIVAAASGYLHEQPNRRIVSLRGYAAMALQNYSLAASDLAELAQDVPEYASAAAYALARCGNLEEACNFLRESLAEFQRDEYTDLAYELLAVNTAVDSDCRERVGALYNLNSTGWTELNWQRDAESIMKQSEETGRPTLALFRSDESYYSRKLLEETISRIDIRERMQEQYLLLDVNAPKNHPLAVERNVHSYPTIIAIDSYGQTLGRGEGLIEASEFNAAFLSPRYDVGRIRGWHVLGPFPADGPEPFEVARDFPNVIDLHREFSNGSETLQWMRCPGTTLSGHVELSRLYPVYERQFAYLHRSFYLSEATDLRMEFTFDDAGAIWIDGDLILSRKPQADGAIHYANPDLHLEAGQHDLLLRVENGTGGMIAIGAIMTKKRSPIPDIRFEALDTTLALLLLPTEQPDPQLEQATPSPSDEIRIRIEKDNILHLWRREWDQYGWTILARLGAHPVQDESGVIYGIQGNNLSSVPLCNKLGLRDSDIILSVNGIGPEHGLNYAAYREKIQELEEAHLDEWTAEILREDRRIRIIYTVDY